MIGAGFSQPRLVARLNMACRREPDCDRAGGARGGDAANTVLDHDTIGRLDAELLCGIKEDVGMRLAARDIR